MRILTQNCSAFARANVYLCGTALSYVVEFKYLGHLIIEELSDTKDFQRLSLQPLFKRKHAYKEIHYLLRGGEIFVTGLLPTGFSPQVISPPFFPR